MFQKHGQMVYRYLKSLCRNEDLAEEPNESIVWQTKTLEDSYIEKEQVMSVMKKIHELPEVEREVVLLRATGALSFRQIGEIVGRSESWARVTFFRAKQKLKEGE